MNKIMSFLALLVPSLASANCTLMYEMSGDQFYTVVRAYEAGEKEDFGKTMAAMVIVESNAGMYVVNHVTKDYGVGQINVNTAYTRAKRRGYEGSKHALIERLIEDEKFNHKNMLLELKFWDRVHDGNWKRIVKSYNAGYSYKTIDDSYYYDKIVRAYKRVDKCFE